VEEHTKLEWTYSEGSCVEGGKWSEDTNLGRQVAAHSDYIQGTIPLAILAPSAKVCELIERETRWWNISLL
jgi:hypothetical protein